MNVPPTDPRRGSGSSPDARPPGWDPRSRSSSGERQLLGSATARTRRVGPYRLLGLIAQGGMGAVYTALHEGLGRTVALKTMLPGAMTSPEDVERFVREAKAASRLTHRNLVPIYDVGDADGVRYLAMELVRGETLHDRIRQQGRLDDGQALAVMIGVSEGLLHAHQAGILHRDLKPANVILEADGTPRVTDFGVAKAVGESRLTATGTALGTPNYMSPEQAMGHNQQLDQRTDVWGLGAILYECLTGQPPFNEGSQVATMQAVVSRAVTAPRAIDPGISRDLEAICLKCLARERELRYATCDELLRDLRACQAGRTIQARAPGPALRLARRVRRHAVLASLSTLTAGSLLALLLVLVLGRRAPPPPAPDPLADAERWLVAREGALADPDRRAALAAELSGTGRPTDAPEALSLPGPAARLKRLRAELALARGEWARAAALDPAAPAGRRARFELARRLADRAEPVCADLRLAELVSLSGGEDEVARLAAAEAVPLLLGAGRWEEALARAPVDHPLRPLAAALSPVMHPTGEAGLVLPGAPPVFLLQRERELVRWSPGAAAYPAPVHTCAADERILALEARPGAAALLVESRGDAMHLQPIPAEGGPPPGRTFALADPHDRSRWAVGDFDGDGVLDAAGVPWTRTSQAVALSSQPDGPSWRMFSPSTPGDELAQRAYLIETLRALDLDGDGRDELIMGSSALVPAGVVVRRLQGEAFHTSSALPIPARVTAFEPWPLEGQRRGILAVVDWAVGEDLHMFDLPVARLPAWAGRDGLYLLEERDGRLELRAHWTWSDEPPSRAEVGQAERIQGWVMRIRGEPWVARAAELLDGPRLDLIRLRDLLEGTQEPTLSLRLRELPARAPQVVDVDGDGEDELWWGGRLLGAGVAVEPAASGDGAAAALERLPRLVAAASLVGAGDEAAGAQLAACLEAIEPGRGGEVRLAAVELPLDLAREAREAATRALGRGRLEEGRRRWSEAQSLLEQAGAAAEAALRDELSPRERAQAALLAEQAWTRAGQPERAGASLERVGEPDGLPGALADELRAAQARAQRGAHAGTWEPSLTARGAQGLVPVSPLAARPGRGGLSVEVSGHRLSGATAEVQLGGGPLVLEAALGLDGPVWVGRAELGLFTGAGELARAELTGLQLDLWSVYSARPRASLVAGGGGLAALGWLPSWRQQLRVRLELTPLPEGTRLCVTLRDPAGQLLLAAERVSPARLPGGRVRVGLRCPPYPTREEACQEHAQGFLARVELGSLRLTASPAPTPIEPDPRARGDLAALNGDDAGAIAAYDDALERADAGPEEHVRALWGRALARARQGDAIAHEDLMLAVQLDPLRMLETLEDGADALLLGGEPERRMVARGLEGLAEESDPLMPLLAAALRGRPLPEFEVSQVSRDRLLAIAYLTLMDDPGLGIDELEPWIAQALRLPRRPMSPTLDYPLAPLSEAERKQLIADVRAAPGATWQARRQSEARLTRLVADRPQDPNGWGYLAQLHVATGNTARAQLCFRQAALLGSDARLWIQVANLAAKRGADEDEVYEILETALDKGLRASDLEATLGLIRNANLTLGGPRLEALKARARR